MSCIRQNYQGFEQDNQTKPQNKKDRDTEKNGVYIGNGDWLDIETEKKLREKDSFLGNIIFKLIENFCPCID